jgi:hypothetical protein
MNRVANALLNSLAAFLQRTGDYRVLRRLTPQRQFSREAPENPFVGIILDTETTGMTPGTDEVIEFGMIKFESGLGHHPLSNLLFFQAIYFGGMDESPVAGFAAPLAANRSCAPLVIDATESYTRGSSRVAAAHSGV